MIGQKVEVNMRKILGSPWKRILVAGILLVSGIKEVVEGELFHLGSHHGVTALGLYHFLKVLPDFYESAKVLENQE